MNWDLWGGGVLVGLMALGLWGWLLPRHFPRTLKYLLAGRDPGDDAGDDEGVPKKRPGRPAGD